MAATPWCFICCRIELNKYKVFTFQVLFSKGLALILSLSLSQTLLNFSWEGVDYFFAYYDEIRVLSYLISLKWKWMQFEDGWCSQVHHICSFGILCSFICIRPYSCWQEDFWRQVLFFLNSPPLHSTQPLKKVTTLPHAHHIRLLE